jgi:hypothetical protein
MKKPGLFSLMPLACLAVVYGQAVKDPVRPNPVRVSSRAQLIASLEQARVRVGDPIKLHFRLKNVSSEAINLMASDFNEDYWLVVTDASGAELPRTEEGDRMRQPSRTGGGIVGSLAPGAEYGGGTIDVTKHYQLDRPGNYFVRIARRIGLPPDMPHPKTAEEGAKMPLEEAVSDLIPFTVTP